MAYKPGLFTNWPWKPLGNFKYLVLAPWVVHSGYIFVKSNGRERDVSTFLIFPFLLWRMLHNQIWITLSRHRDARGNGRIVDKGIEFEQVDRERNWDDQILFNGLILYAVAATFPGASCLPVWRSDGVITIALLHVGPVEFLYYWLHRALHHHYLYSRYHSHHHASIVTEPITSVIHPFAEHMAYYVLFAMPLLTTVWMGIASISSVVGYVTYIDLMNNMGHCNFELIPKWIFSYFPPLKYLMYTPSYHSLHHTQFRTNYSLFMPFYDYIYGTMDKSTDELYETSLKRQAEVPDVVCLTHLTTPESIYHLGVGFASLASQPDRSSRWYLWLIWPVTLWSMMVTRIYGHTFLIERHRFNKLKIQTWIIPKYRIQYFMQWQKESINRLIEKAILEADEKGTKVLCLGLLNQGEELNGHGGLYVERHPEFKVRLVDGSGLAVAVVVNSIPKGTVQVLLRGKLTKVAYAIAFALCQSGIQVATLREHEYVMLKKSLNHKCDSNLLLSSGHVPKIWIVGDDITEEDHSKAPKGTLFIPFSQFPPEKLRSDCFYHHTPAMVTPPSLENVHSCENWLPRRVMSAWRVAAILHAAEGWEEHECGYTITDVDKAWQASLRLGFQPLGFPTHVPQKLS
ncbi:PPM-type phosphatase domain-containing protein [Psidium guajava]|nr:PPM-type phosphatase domain-containing protein [Psidium guajava]